MIGGANADVRVDIGELRDKQTPQDRNRQHFESFLETEHEKCLSVS